MKDTNSPERGLIEIVRAGQRRGIKLFYTHGGDGRLVIADNTKHPYTIHKHTFKPGTSIHREVGEVIERIQSGEDSDSLTTLMHALNNLEAIPESKPLTELGLPTATVGSLKQYGFETTADMRYHTRKEVARIRYVGQKSIGLLIPYLRQ
jgi:hypothetical protein